FNANALQPLLVPVLQLHTGNRNNTNTDIGSFPSSNRTAERNTSWLPQVPNAVATFNLIVGTGDTPPRPGEFNGGLQNLPRFLENFKENNNNRRDTKILGSFVQTGRSRYATAPYQSMVSDANTVHPAMFGNEDGDTGRVYRVENSGGRTPFFDPPNRDWGFDVGLLSQAPDRYASKFAEAKTEATDYFRELNRDDPWVEALLCSKVEETGANALARNGNDVQLTGTDCGNYGG
ncbi:MAG: hypothetical protein SWJ54_25360, partial [Cyanobacteriota bacterium]|nr:hypothetical protein [Cyanobacteriota bacterium]